VQIVGGTGAYTGISGAINARDTVAAILPKLKNGTCDTAHKVRPVTVLRRAFPVGPVTTRRR
jgi:hypothetical protein